MVVERRRGAKRADTNGREGSRGVQAFIEHVQGEMDEGGSLVNMHATQQLTDDQIEHSDAPIVMNVMVCASPWALMCSSPSPTSAWLAR
jgi:hypothetical protein